MDDNLWLQARHGNGSTRCYPHTAVRLPPPDVAGPQVCGTPGYGRHPRHPLLDKRMQVGATQRTGELHRRLGTRGHGPRLGRLTAGGQAQHATTDVMYFDPFGGEELIGVCAVSAKAGSRTVMSRNARQDAGAAEAAVQNRRARYGAAVIPFVMEVGGRPNAAAKKWVCKLAARGDEDNDATPRCNQIRGSISCTLQRYVALQLSRAHGV